jgi:rSAM/selenodomain-associated transferase 1
MMTSIVAPALLVFAKEPAPFAVKTRLAACIGGARAADVYRELTDVTLRHAVEARRAGIVGRVELWCTPDPASAYFRRLAAAHDAALHRQAEGDLGARMAGAIVSALTRAPAALVIGTDCPVLDTAYLAQARALLAEHEAVIGPAEDGGYVLVGARRPLPLADVRWSTPHTLADTTAAFAHAGIRFAALPVSWDVDDESGLARWDALRNAATV